MLQNNKRESNLSGLDPEIIEGKNFFHDVAPCTAVKEFQGRLSDLRQSGKSDQLRFNFTFNHNNFFARISILLTYDQNTGKTIITVKVLSEKDDVGDALVDLNRF